MIIIVIVFVILIFGIFSKQKIYENFLVGAKEGLLTIVTLFPCLLALTVAISVFRESGALDFFISIFSPIFSFLGIPTEIVPLILVKPLSGGASLATLTDILNQYGVDSKIGRIACVIMGSTETILYTLTIYFGCVKIRKTKYTLYPALIADIVGVFIAIHLIN